MLINLQISSSFLRPSSNWVLDAVPYHCAADLSDSFSMMDAWILLQRALYSWCSTMKQGSEYCMMKSLLQNSPLAQPQFPSPVYTIQRHRISAFEISPFLKLT